MEKAKTMDMSKINTASRSKLLQHYNEAVASRVLTAIVTSGTALLTSENSRKIRSLNVERYAILEQVFFACSAFRLNDWMVYCFKELQKAFPSSTRIQWLAAYMAEALDDIPTAHSLYEAILAERPDDTATRKRYIASLQHSGKVTEAIDQLVNHISEFSVDITAWQQLGDLYLSQGCVPQADYCYEELILQSPQNLYYLIIYADMNFSFGKLEKALDYYILSLSIQDDCLRALWGIVMVAQSANQLNAKTKSTLMTPQRKELIKVCLEKLEDVYYEYSAKRHNLGSASSETISELVHGVLQDLKPGLQILD